MHLHPFTRIVLLFVTVVLLSSCDSDGTVESRKSAAYTSQPRRLYISAAMNGSLKIRETIFRQGHDEANIMGNDLVAALTQCGISAQFHNVDALAVDNAEAIAINQFRPDAVLRISSVRETFSQYYHGIVYHLDLIDLQTRQIVWKAEINFDKKWDAGMVLATLIVERLRQDGIINSSCNTAFAEP